MVMLAADVGGTKVAVALVTREGLLLAKTQQPTDPHGPTAVVEQIAAMTGELLVGGVPVGIGVSVPAVLEHVTDRVIWAPNLTGWDGVDVRSMLSARLGIPAFLEYDGHAAVLGEWWVGAGNGYHNVVSIIIGTGIGGGYIADGRLIQGRDRLAGAVGWFPLQGPDGMEHWEQLSAGPSIAGWAKDLLHEKGLGGTTSLLSDNGITAKDVFDAARQGDPLACEVIEQVAQLIGQGISVVVSALNPDVVVLGGSVGQQGDLLIGPVQRAVQRWAQPYSARDVRIVSSTLGEEAGLLGAAYAAFQRLDHPLDHPLNHL